MVTGYVLAGGRSSRMGRDKTCMRINGQLLIELVIERVRPCVGRICVIASRRNARALGALNVDAVITDTTEDRGPLMGLYTGLMQSDTALNLFVACDMPWIDMELLERLLSAWQPGRDAIAGFGPDGRQYPLPMLCHVNACRTAGALLHQHRDSLHELLSLPSGYQIGLRESECRRWFTNINTWADYALACHDTPLPFRR